ncbi:MAG: hypothetical protein ABI822_12635 [Bryobacteraceae bacterium]
MKWNGKTVAVVLAVAGVAGTFVWKVSDANNRLPGSTYSQFLEEVREGKVAAVRIESAGAGASPVTYQTKAGRSRRTVLPSDYRDALNAMQQSAVDVEIKATSPLRVLGNSVPFLLLLGFWLFMMGKLRSRTRIA